MGTASASRVEARGYDTAVVEDEEVARMEEVRKVAEEVVAILAGTTIKHKHATGSANGRGSLRDELFGEIEMEVGYAHYS